MFQLKEQMRAEANDAALASQQAAHASQAAAAAERLDPGADGVHDLGAVTVPVLPTPGVGAQATATTTTGSAAHGAPPTAVSHEAAGMSVPGTNAAWWGPSAPAATHPDAQNASSHADSQADDGRFSWRG